MTQTTPVPVSPSLQLTPEQKTALLAEILAAPEAKVTHHSPRFVRGVRVASLARNPITTILLDKLFDLQTTGRVSTRQTNMPDASWIHVNQIEEGWTIYLYAEDPALILTRIAVAQVPAIAEGAALSEILLLAIKGAEDVIQRGEIVKPKKGVKTFPGGSFRPSSLSPATQAWLKGKRTNGYNFTLSTNHGVLFGMQPKGKGDDKVVYLRLEVPLV